MESCVKELITKIEEMNSGTCIGIDFENQLLVLNQYEIDRFSEKDKRKINELFFFKCIDYICANSENFSFDFFLDQLYNGKYCTATSNMKSYLFEALELCPPKLFLRWIDKKFDEEDILANVNIQAFNNYIDSKRKRGLTHGEIRYSLICESSSTLFELLLSKIYRDRLVSKQAWLAVFRLKQQLPLTTSQKDVFADWLGIL